MSEPAVEHHAILTTAGDDRLTGYLRSLPQRRLASETVAYAAERLWNQLRAAVPGIVAPNGIPTDDGGLRFSWIRNGRYLDAEIAADGQYGWFFRDRAAGTTEEGESLTVELVPPEELLSHLRTLFS